MKRVLITNSVPSNGGDGALLLATILGLKDKFPNIKINVLCKDPKHGKEQFADIDFDYDWEYLYKAGVSNSNKCIRLFKNFLLKYLPKIFNVTLYTFASSQEKNVIKLYKTSDYIISSPGGYINDYYTYNFRTIAFNIALYYKRKLIFFCQSIGPFNNVVDHTRIKKVLNNATYIILRENISCSHLEKVGCNNINLKTTTDVAFYLYNHYYYLFKEKKEQENCIVVSFRKWDSQSNVQDVIKLGTKIVISLIEKGYSVTFLSTCQGLEYYIDDSEIGLEILKKLDNRHKKFFEVNRDKYNVLDLIKKYSEFNAYIGMRLHGAILSMLGGTPAFNLGYEEKTQGIYSAIGLDSFQVNFNQDFDKVIMPQINSFLKNKSSIGLRNIVEQSAAKAAQSFDIFV